MNKLDKDYQELLQDILDNGTMKEDRTGTGTVSVFGRQIRHKMSDGFPLLTTKKMHTNGVITELLWFLRGETNIKSLVEQGNMIWVGDAYKKYEADTSLQRIQSYHPHFINGDAGVEPPEFVDTLSKEQFIDKIKTDDEFSKKWGELGPIYGKQWRSWKVTTNDEQSPNYENTETSIDQIANLINDLKTNPDSRRLMVNAWNVEELDQMTLPPCHYGFQVYTRELTMREQESLGHKYGHLNWEEQEKLILPTREISLMWNQRSCDFPLGIPYNIASYGFLLEIIAKKVNMVPGELIGNLGDCHIYKNQIDGCKEQLTRGGYDLSELVISDKEVLDISEYNLEDFKIEKYTSHPTIKFPLSN